MQIPSDVERRVLEDQDRNESKARPARHSTACVLENRKLVAKSEDLRLQGSTSSKTGGHKSEKSDEKIAHRGSHHNLMNDRNPVFSDRTEFSVITPPRLNPHPCGISLATITVVI
jgi:hypothetical protein